MQGRRWKIGICILAMWVALLGGCGHREPAMPEGILVRWGEPYDWGGRMAVCFAVENVSEKRLDLRDWRAICMVDGEMVPGTVEWQGATLVQPEESGFGTAWFSVPPGQSDGCKLIPSV